MSVIKLIPRIPARAHGFTYVGCQKLQENFLTYLTPRTLPGKTGHLPPESGDGPFPPLFLCTAALLLAAISEIFNLPMCKRHHPRLC